MVSGGHHTQLIWPHFLAYNLLRTAIAVAADNKGIEARQVSFTGAK